ncbi:hypothetical protein P879_05662 [Paragonimus westermani]|uniref:Major facilitator superfamily associated domain-containing protein n=1 Tax=Paragonimus westermani TaxID=34504 RepID=A0A8T0DLK3_9TREM|nr:hypothetical protein P879_05662 [Paragonimus westermani]
MALQVLVVLSLATTLCILVFVMLPQSSEFIYDGALYKDGSFVSQVVWNESTVSRDTSSEDQTIDKNICWPNVLYGCHIFNNTMQGRTIRRPLGLVGVSYQSRSAKYLSSHDDLIQFAPQNAVFPMTIQLRCAQRFTEKQVTCTMINNRKFKEADKSTLAVLLLIKALLTCVQAPIMNLLDSVTCHLLDENHSHCLGHFRAFASLGYMISVSSVGWLVTHQFDSGRTSSPTFASVGTNVTTNDWSPAILCGTTAASAGAIISGLLSFKTNPLDLNLKQSVLLVAHSPLMVKCIINAFLAGLVYSLNFEYLFYVMTHEFGISPSFMGLLTTLNILCGEIPTFMAVGWLLKRFGETFCLCIAHFFYALQMYIYGSCENQLTYLLFCPLFGASFPLLYSSLANYATASVRQARLANTNVISSMHSLLNAVLFGISLCFGASIWGVLMQHYSGRYLFFLSSVISCILVVITPVISRFVDRLF